MLTINDLSYFIGGRALYENISLHVKPKDKIGLIGANGVGKSTLLRLIDGEYQADEGYISKSKECTIGFLNQDLLSYSSDESILSVALQAFERENRLLTQINKTLQLMETDYSDELLNKLTKYQEQYEILDGYSLQSKGEEILEGLGFKTEELTQPLQKFSGGWRMRVMLAKILLAKPNLLMLDEPTNHLDLPSIEWLENYIKNYEGAVIIVSHDRQFINNCVKSIAEVSHQRIDVYAGDYDFYLSEKDLRREIQNNSFKNQQKKIKETEEFINRFKAKATKAKQVQSRVKALDKIDKIDEIEDENRQINFNFTFSKVSGKVVLELKNISKAYGDKIILKNTTTSILRGDKIALIGANGKGKSTLLRIINGSEEIEGERTLGYNVFDSFYAQHQLESLGLENEILEELKTSGLEKTELELRQILGSFLFQDEEVFKKIKVLSGGEKSRVALAKTLISESNFLLLDEPTNHLDIQSVNMLTQALNQYEGTYVVVSHDRHFVKNIANKIWFIEDYQIKEYPGTYDEWSLWMKDRDTTTKEELKAEEPQKKINTKVKTEDSKLKKKLKSLKSDLEKIELSIEEKEKEKSAIELELASSDVLTNPELLGAKSQSFQHIEDDLTKLNTEWEEIALEIDEIESNA